MMSLRSLTFPVESLCCSEKDFWRGIGPDHGAENQENKGTRKFPSLPWIFLRMLFSEGGEGRRHDQGWMELNGSVLTWRVSRVA